MKRKFSKEDEIAANHLIEKYGSDEAQQLFDQYIREGSGEKAQKLFKSEIVVKFDDLPGEILASILQYLTIGELNLLLTTSKRIHEIIVRYSLHERRSYRSQLYTFGAGIGGMLGNNRTDSHFVGTPTLISVQNRAVDQVSCGSNDHTAVITKDGQLYTFGDGRYGKLGDGLYDHKVGTPTLIQIENKKIVQVSCGTLHTAVITEDGQLYTFGRGQYGRLGDGRVDEHDVGTPTLISIGDKKIVQVSCGNFHTAVITDDGHLYTFGLGINGRLGDGRTNNHSVGIPTLIPIGDKKCAQVSCKIHTAVITKDGSLYTFGRGFYGQLGDGRIDEHDVGTPTLIPIGDKKIVQVSCGDEHTAVITDDGQLYTFGNGMFGRLGDGRTIYHTVGTPTLIPMGNMKIIRISCGGDYTAVITASNQLYTFGDGEYGTLGDGRTDDHAVGTPTLIPMGNRNVVRVSCGHSHAAVISYQPDNPNWLRIASQCLSCDSPIDGHCNMCLTPICYSCFDEHMH